MAYTKEEIKHKLATSDGWALKALSVLHSRQTTEEQHYGVTRVHNSRGFTAFDAEILTSFFLQVRDGRTLSHKQMALLHKKLPKYWNQIKEEIEAKEAEKIEKLKAEIF